jgi:hypothetical protein
MTCIRFECIRNAYTFLVTKSQGRTLLGAPSIDYRILLKCMSAEQSCDSSVGIALGYGPYHRISRVRLPTGLGIFIFTAASRTALGPTQPPIQWVRGALSLEVKRSGREAARSPPSSAEVKNA